MTDYGSALALACGALVLLLAGHVLRLGRWSILMRQIGHPRLGDGFMALSLGYVIDAVVPLRLGEIARGAYYARRVGAGTAFVLASILVERVMDLVAVWAITCVALWAGVFPGVALAMATLTTMVLAGAVVLACLATSRSVRFRRMVWAATSVFNDAIRLVLLDTLWSTLEVSREARARWALLAAQTLGMWALYGASFALLASSLGLAVHQVFQAAVGAPLLPMMVPLLAQGGAAGLCLVLFSFAPMMLFLLYLGAKTQFGVSAWGAVSWMQAPGFYRQAAPASRSRFVERDLYGGFLARRFRGTQDLVSDFEANALGDIVVQRMLRGGSDALTVMVQLADQLCIRKYASGAAAGKLAGQCAWLRRHEGALPLVRVLGEEGDGDRFYYDMEYSHSSRDMFDMVHVFDVETCWTMLQDVLQRMTAFHAQTRLGEADEACTTRYAAEKVTANLVALQRAVPEFFAAPNVVINGARFEPALLERFAAPGFVASRLRLRSVATIHGDLTIENILTDPGRPGGWFLIDPNVGNLFESPLLDHAKILQSLHLGYESLNRDLSCRFVGGRLDFPIARSAQYAALHGRTVAWQLAELGAEAVREIRLHEIVHYFRLTPYKFRRGMEPGLVFLGCLCQLVQRYVDEYEPGLVGALAEAA